MRVRLLAAIAAALLLSACSHLDLFGPHPDLNQSSSGDMRRQTVAVTYLPAARNATMDSVVGLSSQVIAGCPQTPPNQPLTVPIPIVIAVGQAVVDYYFDSVDRRIQRLKKAAVREYTATTLIEGVAFQPGDCLVMTRTPIPNAQAPTELPEPSAIFVFRLQRHASEPGNSPRYTAVTWVPIYATVSYAVAQSTNETAGHGTVSRINATVALSSTVVQSNRISGRNEPGLLNSSSFTFPGLIIGQKYCGGEVRLDGCQRLPQAFGPIFVPPAESTIGVVGASVVERGALADLEDASAADKATRTSIRAALGEIIKAELTP